MTTKPADLRLKTTVLALALAPACGAHAAPLLVQPGSPAIYKYLPAPTPASEAATAPTPSGTVVCFPMSGSTTPPAGTKRVEAILVGGGGAGGVRAVGSGGGGPGGGSGYISTTTFNYTSGQITFVVGSGGVAKGSTVALRSGKATTLTYNGVTYTANGGGSGEGYKGGNGGSGGGAGNTHPSLSTSWGQIESLGGGGGGGYRGNGGMQDPGPHYYGVDGGVALYLRASDAGGASGGSGGGGINGGSGQGSGYGGTPGTGWMGVKGSSGAMILSPAVMDLVAPCNPNIRSATHHPAPRNSPNAETGPDNESSGYGAGGSGQSPLPRYRPGSSRLTSSNFGDPLVYGGDVKDGIQGVVLMRYLTTP